MIEKYNLHFEYVESLMLGFLAYQYLKLWIAPEIDDAEKIFQFAGLMAFEFVMVHSGVMMASVSRKTSLLLFVPLYGLFALSFNLIIGGNIVAYVYLIAVFNRMRFAFFNVSERLKDIVFGKSVLAVTIYFLLMIVVAFCNESVPEFGLSDENLARLGYAKANTHGGLFVDEPQTAICLGFLYYSILSFSSISRNKALKNK